jgi:hypothetical protein
MRKLNDDLIMMNSLFILVKFQMDFTLEYYKNKNISPEEWNTLWKLVTSFKEYTSYMIPGEVFMTIHSINAIMESETVDSKNAVMALGDAINELNKEDEQMIEMKSLNEPVEPYEERINETTLGGKKRRNKTKKLIKHKASKNRRTMNKRR